MWGHNLKSSTEPAGLSYVEGERLDSPSCVMLADQVVEQGDVMPRCLDLFSQAKR